MVCWLCQSSPCGSPAPTSPSSGILDHWSPALVRSPTAVSFVALPCWSRLMSPFSLCACFLWIPLFSLFCFVFPFLFQRPSSALSQAWYATSSFANWPTVAAGVAILCDEGQCWSFLGSNVRLWLALFRKHSPAAFIGTSWDTLPLSFPMISCRSPQTHNVFFVSFLLFSLLFRAKIILISVLFFQCVFKSLLF